MCTGQQKMVAAALSLLVCVLGGCSKKNPFKVFCQRLESMVNDKKLTDDQFDRAYRRLIEEMVPADTSKHAALASRFDRYEDFVMTIKGVSGKTGEQQREHFARAAQAAGFQGFSCPAAGETAFEGGKVVRRDPAARP